MNEVEFITSAKYDESLWMKVGGERGKSVLFVGCVIYLFSSSVAVVDSCYNRLTKDVVM